VLLALVMVMVMAPTGSSAPAAGAVGSYSAPAAAAVGSYYASAAAWAWNATWLLGADKLAWGVPVALVSGGITALIVRRLKGNWFPGLIGGIAGTVGGPLLVLLCVFLVNFGRYPVIHEAGLQIRPHRLGLGAAYPIFYALQNANLKVPGRWNVVFTGPGESGAIQSDIRQILLMAVPGVLFPEVPSNSNNLDAPRLPEPPEQPGITIHGDNALAHGLQGLGGCFVTKVTGKMVDGFAQFYGIENLVWIEIGNGSPWQSVIACSG
jgi:hypothetical protein